MKRSWYTYITSISALAIILVASIFVALFFGAYRMDIGEVFPALFSQEPSPQTFLLQNIRLPRILLATLVGGGLAISGAAIQGLFRNPLADQTLIGVTSGASLFAVLGIVFMGSVLSSLAELFSQSIVSIFSFAGGFVTTYMVYFLSRKNGQTDVMTMLLAGIAISAFAASISGVFIYLSNDQQLRDITFWTLGSLSAANWTQIAVALPIVLLGGIVISTKSKSLNAILLGEKEARYLGIDVEKVKSTLIFFTALVVGVCISVSGIIGFVGLVIPHFLRLMRGPDYRYLLPASALLGAVFMIFADTLARTIIAPGELPIGILTSMVGAPFFLWLLIKSQKERMTL